MHFQNVARLSTFQHVNLDLKTLSGRLTTFNPKRPLKCTLMTAKALGKFLIAIFIVMEINEAAPKYYNKMSPSDFLEWERKQEYKHEYIGGEIVAMAGASINHNRILTNLIVSAGSYLKNKACNIFPSDLRIAVKSKNSFFYPDATIVCGEPEFDDDGIKDTVKNPSVIFEILSPSTEDYDTGKKFFFYMQIESLRQYIIIDSRSIQVRTATKMENGTWKFLELTQINDTLFIDSIQMEVGLDTIYDGIKF